MKNLLVIIFILMSLQSFAQPCAFVLPGCEQACADPCNQPVCDDCNEDVANGVPIDGGLSWLLLTGAGLATRNHIRRKKKKKSA